MLTCFYKKYLAWVFPVLLVVFVSSAPTQDLEPRAYSNAPVGLNFLVAGYTYSQGGVLTDPAVPLENANIELRNMILAYVHSFDLGGMSSKFNVVVPYACASGTATFAGEPKERNICGFADPRFRLTVNFFGAPALSLQEFTGYKQDTIVGASLQVTPPAGQYDSTKLLNIGTNRWSFEPGIGVSKALGRFTAELAAGVIFYSDNTDYLEGQTLETDPIYSLQGHIVYNFKSGLWCALDGTYYWGGQTRVNDVKGDTLQENTRMGATLSLPINRYHSVKLFASSGVSTRTGSNFDTVGLSWQYRWGDGL